MEGVDRYIGTCRSGGASHCVKFCTEPNEKPGWSRVG